MLKEIFNFIKNNKWYVLLVLGLLGLYFYQFHGGLSSDSEKWDHFGSYIGGIFSAVTLLSVLHGMQLERKRFNEQKEEFEKDKKEQEERRRKEDFERNFFILLEQKNIKQKNLKKDIEKIIEVICSNNTYYLFMANRNDYDFSEKFKENRELYTKFLPYYLCLISIIKYLYDNREYDEQNSYLNLLKSVLDSNDMILLACLSLGRNEKEYISDLSLFQNLDLKFLEILLLENVLNEEDMLIINKEKISINFSKNPFVKELFDTMHNNREIDISLLEDEDVYNIADHLLIKILRGFDDRAFSQNINYNKLYVRYNKFIKRNTFSQ
ncbi:putative phage abortive infection protein [Bisgaard Taxon 10/6]|uniref:putative phage abortive infection protein n=1 Tax=Exercitatus varius TaxID=67857 RepID=UPI00294B4F9F|nr:putative phage abortive infection protein [Exercitatus varius]MDG2956155.1 putative phage abortive infection protein [Exercitatus varius]MDG2963255.1 putative phage abortive infection protein [Exercitatus varius]MDG2965347.1 putative phage abortive infection protein [Exercitatus varius]